MDLCIKSSSEVPVMNDHIPEENRCNRAVSIATGSVGFTGGATMMNVLSLTITFNSGASSMW